MWTSWWKDFALVGNMMWSHSLMKNGIGQYPPLKLYPPTIIRDRPSYTSYIEYIIPLRLSKFRPGYVDKCPKCLLLLLLFYIYFGLVPGSTASRNRWFNSQMMRWALWFFSAQNPVYSFLIQILLLLPGKIHLLCWKGNHYNLALLQNSFCSK